jgi:sugar-specific transcriptional regulator TrmB
MELSEVLNKIGLGEKETRVYLALLELGTAPVQAIAQKAGLKRPTTYLVLDSLQEKGLISTVPQAKKALYTAESPEQLLSESHRRSELLKRFLPNLLALHNARKEKPQVQLFQGKEGVRQIYQQIYESDGVWFFGTIREVIKIYPEGLQGFIERIKKEQFRVRDLLTTSEADIAYARKTKQNANYEIRFARRDSDFPTDSAIFGDKVVFFSFRPQIFAVLITSREISQSLKTLYELAWQSAERFRSNERLQ